MPPAAKESRRSGESGGASLRNCIVQAFISSPRRRGKAKFARRINFSAINRAALAALPELIAEWAPDGRKIGREWVAINPRRPDRSLGSFKINLYSGRWSDFATGDAGGDVISLAAYLHDLSQGDAARMLAERLGIECEGR